MTELGLSYQEAVWEWSLTRLMRLQKAALENAGHPQDWGQADMMIRMGQIFEELKKANG